MTDQVDEVERALDSWRDSLMGLTKRNRLISFKESKTGSIRIDDPGPDEIFELLRRGRRVQLRGDETLDDGTVQRAVPKAGLHTPRPDDQLATSLRNLMRKANQEFLDRGLAVLYVAFGMLRWLDEDRSELSSPLLLLPVHLDPEGPKGHPRLTIGEDDAVLNPALALRLRDFNVQLPGMDELDDLRPSEVAAQVASAVREQKGWRVDSAHAVLSTFSFHKEAMVRDLEDNKDAILTHPIVRALGTSNPSTQTDQFVFDPIDVNRIDEVAPPESTPMVLDADSSQRVAIAAALGGNTFVMDGPPGTGKSQTIANMIGALMHAGKSVLFVSEKMAALDVVRNRLAGVGLDNYLLELHSHKATRKAVATELLRTLDNETVPPNGMDHVTRGDLRAARSQLNSYATAMNEKRQPLEQSLHQVLGLLSELNHLPAAPSPDRRPLDLTPESHREVRETAALLQRAWRPAAQGASFLWRHVIDDTSLEVRLYRAESALEELHGTAALCHGLAAAFELNRPDDALALHALMELQHAPHRPAVLDEWLTAGDFFAYVDNHAALQTRLDEIHHAEAAVFRACGVSWFDLPDDSRLSSSETEVQTQHTPVDLTPMSSRELEQTRSGFEDWARTLRERLAALRGVTAELGLTEPVTFADADRVVQLVDLSRESLNPERHWFSDQGLREAKAALRELRAHLRELTEAEERASGTYTADALKAPIAELQDRFTNLHKGIKKLASSYRADKRVVAGLLTEATSVKDGISRLSDAVSWAEVHESYERWAATNANLLGSHWQGRNTDVDRVARAMEQAERVLDLCGGRVPYAVADIFHRSEAAANYGRVTDAARADLDRWKAKSGDPDDLAGQPGLLVETVDQSIDWLEAHLKPLIDARDGVGDIERVLGREVTLLEARRLQDLAETARATHQRLEHETQRFASSFGPLFRGTETDVDGIEEGLNWARDVRGVIGSWLSDDQVAALRATPLVEHLPAAYERWVQARDAIVKAFGEARRDELLREFSEYDDAHSLVADLREDSIGQEEWFTYSGARNTLAEYGLEATIDFCVEERVPASQVPGVVERALLRGWADAVIQGDGRVRPIAAREHENLVDKYRSLDRELIGKSAADIIRSANARRPRNTSIGGPGVIRREGMKKRRHVPVRNLMQDASATCLDIKPCFMMSPLAVSQYLPSDIQFDVVIFDEASQVTAGDAINCIYRGKALILAGDDKQLPPTSFFDRQTDDSDDEASDVDDFESVLELAKGCGAFNNLGLKWHYRSRHEDLIAFSNYRFYDGNLVTYPSAQAEGEHVGVEFFHAGGTYLRGGGARNPEEAARVAERVMEHYTQRPELSLGVVTFSVQQRDAVVEAVEQARSERRDLDRYFDAEDRLNGFFVRSLESVQGDERDVIIFSVGYGPDEAGKITTNFGVLNQQKGWRRLNVGVTRARQRVEVVASMRAGDIPPSTNENVEHLRAYLDFAERGRTALALELGTSGLGPDSPFEESVIKAITSWGYDVEPQVGSAGFRIDIGVRHPDHPGAFALGVECDGYQYHSAPAARDRDRLRDEILRGLGWRLHRIWGTAWYRNRSEEENHLRSVIEEAIATPVGEGVQPLGAIPREAVSSVAVESDSAPRWTTPYRQATQFILPRYVDPYEPEHYLHMVPAIERLADEEGPVHMSLVHERLRDWWDIGRISQRVRANIDRAIDYADVHREGEFIHRTGQSIDAVRVPSEEVTRKAEQVHPTELCLAVELLLRDVGSVDRGELVVALARIFGWSRRGDVVDRRLNGAIDLLLEDGTIRDQGAGNLAFVE